MKGPIPVEIKVHNYERPRVHDDINIMDDDVMMYSWKDPYSIGINLHKKDPYSSYRKPFVKKYIAANPFLVTELCPPVMP